MSSDDIVLSIKRIRADGKLTEAEKQTQEKEYKTGLYNSIYKLLYALGRKYLSYAIKRGYEQADISAAAWIGVEKAINDFDSSKGYVFNTFLNFHVSKAIKSFLGLRSGAHKVDMRTVSLYEPIKDGEDITLADTLEDAEASETYLRIEEFDYYKTLRREIEKLSPELKEVVKRYYFNDMSIAQISHDTDRTTKELKYLKNKALLKLRRNQHIRKAYLTEYYSYKHIGLNTFKSTLTSSTEWAVLMLEDKL